MACDRTSRTSVTLARILLREVYGNRPEFKTAGPEIESMLASADAAVTIGDAALKFAIGKIPDGIQVLDLAEAWKTHTGLPFIFAFWAARAGFQADADALLLQASRDFGVAHTADISTRYAALLEIPEQTVREYLEQNVYYYMDDDCLQGLSLFYEKAEQAGIVPIARPLEFV